jgi:hypothetical protein
VRVISFGDHTKFISREVRSSLSVNTYTERFAEYGQNSYETEESGNDTSDRPSQGFPWPASGTMWKSQSRLHIFKCEGPTDETGSARH